LPEVQKRRGKVGGTFARPVILQETEGLLDLREKSSNGDAELGPGFQYPDTRDPKR